MTIALHPYALGLPLLTWAGLFGIVGALVGGWLFLRAAPKFGTGIRGAYGIVLASVLAGFVGARVLHMADYADFYSKAPFHAVYLWNGGLSLWGGVLGGLLGGLALARQRGLEVARVADAAAAPALIGLVVGRLGDFLAGSRAAEASSLPWAVAYTNESATAFADGAAVHPVAMYELLLDALIAAAIWRWRHAAPRGALLPVALAAWAAGRFVIAFVRVDPERLGMQQAQWIGLLVVVGVGLWAWRSRERLGLRGSGGAGWKGRSPED